MANEFSGVPVLGNPFSGDVFADEAIALELVNGVLRITLASFKMVEPAPPSGAQLVVAGRLVMGIPGAQRLALSLFDYLKKQGLDPASLVETGEHAPN